MHIFFHWFIFIFFSFDKIYKLFFLEFSIFSLREFLVIIARAELELLFDFTSQDSLVVVEEPKRLAESALFLSIMVELLGCSFYSQLSLKSLKNLRISSSTSL